MKWPALTTPPAPRPPPSKHPLFTTKVFSTKSFGPGHLLGAGILVVGLVGITKLFVSRVPGQARLPGSSGKPEDEPKLARAENDRGQYGRKP